MIELIFMRHGESAMQGLYCGRLDPPLTRRGIRQTRLAARLIRAFEPQHVYLSDSLRARQTAHIAVPHMHAVIHKALREMDFGGFEGLSANEAAQHFPGEWQQYLDDHKSFTFPGGDNISDYIARAATTISKLTAHHAGQRLLIISHKGFITSALSHLLHGDSNHALCYDICPSGFAHIVAHEGFSVLKRLY